MLRWLYKTFGNEETKDILSFTKHCLSHDAHPFVQFAKYGLAGGLATIVYMVSYGLTDHFWVHVGDAPNDDVRSWRYVQAVTPAFFISGIASYVANIKLVFVSGRHSRTAEVLMFFGVAFIGYLIGTFLGKYLIKEFGLHEHIAFISTLIASVMVNYVCRKFIIFKS